MLIKNRNKQLKFIIMKKEYLRPVMEVEEIQVSQMLAESLVISDDTVDGTNALTKDNVWNIWGEE